MRTLPAAIDELSLDELSGNALSPISEQKEHKFLSDFFISPPMTSSSPMQIPNSNSPFGSPPLASLGESLFQQNKRTIDLPSATTQLKGLMGLPGTLNSEGQTLLFFFFRQRSQTCVMKNQCLLCIKIIYLLSKGILVVFSLVFKNIL
uniref:Uncharacterized protein n=1 Tax=Brugia timori TaxID=42155 RepID=A0A0R3QFH8_9BILA